MGHIATRRQFTRNLTSGWVLLVAEVAVAFLLTPYIIAKLGAATYGGWALMIVMIGLYAVIGVANRTRNLDEYFVAGRRIPAFFNGSLTSGRGLHMTPVTDLVVRGAGPLDYHVDGEPHVGGERLRVAVRPRALFVAVP